MKKSAALYSLKLNMPIDVQKLLFDFSDAAVIFHVPTLLIKAINPGYQKIAGFSESELIGRPIHTLLSQRASRNVKLISAELLIAEPGLHEEVSFVRKDGSIFLGALNVVLAEEHGEQIAIFIIRDNTERKKLERELITKHLALKEAYEELQRFNFNLTKANEEIHTAQTCLIQLEKMATLGRFAAGVAHEVNNPMAFILQNLCYIQEFSTAILPILKNYLVATDPGINNRERLEEFVSELTPLLNESIEGAQRVTNLVRQLHSFSNVAIQEAELTDLHKVIESSLLMVKNQINHQAQLIREYDILPPIVCVPGQIGQVILNLLVNAIHAIEERQSEHHSIIIRTRNCGESVAIEVRDTGCGISPEHLKRIMEPFFTTKTAGKGSGLGLSISSNIIQMHGGQLEVESKRNQGTIMRIVLPKNSKLEMAGKPMNTKESGLERRMKIFLIDDEVNLLRALKRSLARVHDFTSASSCKEAFELLDQNPDIDLILMDLMMPEMDGIQLYQKLIDRFPQFKGRVAFMSGGVFTDPIESFLKTSKMEVLIKPFRVDELNAIIKKLFNNTTPI